MSLLLQYTGARKGHENNVSEKKESQKVKKNELLITVKEMEGKRTTTRRERGEEVKVHRQNEGRRARFQGLLSSLIG